MNKLTKLEDVVIEVFKLKNREEIAKLTQNQLDKKTEQIIQKLTPQDLIDHTRVVYNKTTGRFKTDPHIQEGIVDELIEFMNLLNEGDLVLDLGCGSGRDTLFMTTTSLDIRKSLMQRIRNGKRTIEKYLPPEKTLRVIALDNSEEIQKIARNRIIQNKSTIKNFPVFVLGDMHNPVLKKKFHGIWSCAALFVHTPKELIKPAIKLWSDYLFIGGKFYLSYINGRMTERYNKLLRSSSGNIKYFSQPDYVEIRKVAKKYGLKELMFRITDFEIHGKLIQKNFFANHIFEKKPETRLE